MPPSDTAVAVQEDQTHPLVAAIDARMPQIAEILPDGMRAERFRKVVVQAMLRNPDLWSCTPISVITAITEAAEIGIEPTGVLGKGWLIPYRGEAKFIPGWRGFVDLLWRADRILLTVDVVRAGDEFSYQRGTDAFLHHTPDLSDPERESSDDNVTYAYVLARFPDGRVDFEVMSRVALDKIRTAALAKAKDKSKAIWNLHPGEMMKKTPVRRLAKRLPLSPAVQAMLARDEDTDYETPIERVPDPKREGLRDRITQRTAAIRGESTGESEAADSGGAVPEEAAASAAGAPSSGGSPKGDPWMRKIHAVGSERGYDHDALHDWAVRLYKVASLSELNPRQRGEFLKRVEDLPLIGGDCAHPPKKHVVTDENVTCGECGTIVVTRRAAIESPDAARAHAAPGEPSAPAEEEGRADGSDRSGPTDTPSTEHPRSSSEAATAQAPVFPGVEPAPAPTDAEILAVTGGEIIPPKPGTDEYRALPNGTARAAARTYWDARKAGEPEQESLASALGAPLAE